MFSLFSKHVEMVCKICFIFDDGNAGWSKKDVKRDHSFC